MSVPSTRPVVILVTGAPGTGKTTLAGRLASALALPRIDKDEIRDGMRFTVGPGSTNEPKVWELLYSTLEAWLGLNVSVVVDMTAYPGLTDVNLAERVIPLADLVNVHCRSNRAAERFADRNARHPHFGPDRVREKRDATRANEARRVSEDPLGVECPTLIVDTTNEYDPGLTEVRDWLLRHSKRTLPLTPIPRR